MTEYYLWLLQFMAAANPRSVQLIRHYGSVKNVYEAFKNGEPKFLKPVESAALKTASLDKSREIMQTCEKYNFRVMTIDDENYSVALKNIYNPPVVLFVSGELCRNELCITVIGTRDACDYSYRITRKLCSRLARDGVTIVSGMAIGIDKTAHTAAVEVKGRTIGVLACGFAVDYPKFSMPFRQEIINAGGAVVSELLPEQRGERGYFNYRNRIMSGLSRGTLIIEAGEKSGCHITANHCYNQNRDLFCVPPADIFEPRFRGVISYIRDGAVPVFDHSDILNEYLIKPRPALPEIFTSEKISEENKPPEKQKPVIQMVSRTAEEKALVAKAEIKEHNIIPESCPEPDLSELSAQSLVLVELLKDGAKTVDVIAEKSGLALSADELSDLLLELEIDGVIESAAGSSYKLCKVQKNY